MEPLVSIVCMTYNQVNYIADAISGFVHQETNFPYEIIIHDDCSNDGTSEVVMEYAAKYSDRIVPVFEKENQYSKGVPIYKDILRPLTRGKYIAMCEGDDYWIDKTKLQTQFNFMEANLDYSLCVHNAIVVDYSANLTYLSEAASGDKEKTLSELILQGGGLVNPTASMFFRKRSDCYYRDTYGAPVGDHFMIMRLASFGRVRWMACPMSVYRYGAEGSFTKTNRLADERYYLDYGRRYIHALNELASDLEGRCRDAFDERIAFQKADMDRNVKTASFCSSQQFDFQKLKGLSAKNSLRAFGNRMLPDNGYRILLRSGKLIQKKKAGTLLCKSALAPGSLC